VKVGRYLTSTILVLVLAGAAVAGLVTGALQPLLGLDLVGGVSVVLTAPDGTSQEVMEQAVETIRERVDRLGVAEPDITLEGDVNISVQIPEFGGQSQERLLELIGTTARLEFREVLETIPPGSENYESTEVTPRDVEFQELVDQEVVYTASDTPRGEDPVLFRLGELLLAGDDLARAQALFLDPVSAGPESQPGWRVSFRFEGEGANTLEEITERLSAEQKQMAIVLDRRVESAPTVQSALPGEGEITGDFTEDEARDLAVVLQSGSLPVELEQSQVETVSATLGRQSLRQGLLAGVVGLIGLALYLAFYYRLLGVVTWIGMAIWAALALGLVSLLGEAAGYSLTLAGVAGIVISLGVTADSYIVFYERVKDEVRKGKSVRAAVQPAFASAWRTIVAADIVTILAAVVLYVLAVGSVRGFALTLGLSTLLDMFVVYFYKRPTVFLIARSRFLSELRGMGLQSAVVVGKPQPQPVRGGSK
jgi:protein-export membrane protein SecD